MSFRLLKKRLQSASFVFSGCHYLGETVGFFEYDVGTAGDLHGYFVVDKVGVSDAITDFFLRGGSFGGGYV